MRASGRSGLIPPALHGVRDVQRLAVFGHGSACDVHALLAQRHHDGIIGQDLVRRFCSHQCANTVAYRLFAVTYYLTVPGAGENPRLMRQVNGLNPVPVADNIINLQFAYDTYNQAGGGALDANQADPIGAGESPNLIQKINIVLMGQSILKSANKSQNMYLATSVSTRDMTFCNSYGYSTTSCQ